MLILLILAKMKKIKILKTYKLTRSYIVLYMIAKPNKLVGFILPTHLPIKKINWAIHSII